MSDFNLTHHFLIAMPSMQEGIFAGTLTYICEHNENGALGIVLNRPISLTLGEMFDQINIPLHQPHLQKMPVYFGGPVQTERGFVLHDTPGNWQSTLLITTNWHSPHPEIFWRRWVRGGAAQYDSHAGLCRLGSGAVGARGYREHLVDRAGFRTHPV